MVLVVRIVITSIIVGPADRKSTRLNSSHTIISYAVFCLKKKMGPKGAPVAMPAVEAASLGCIEPARGQRALLRRPEGFLGGWLAGAPPCLYFFFNKTPPTEISTLPLPAALPI